MNANRFRPYTAVTMMLALMMIAVTGFVLFLAPHGPGSGYWQWLGLTKHELKDIHLYLAFLAVVLMLFHGYLNLKPMSLYLKGKRGRLWHHPLLWAGGGVVVVIWLALNIGS
ncbi:DUF4405 domain-containing protein [Vibrio quintilis]|uniref:Flavinylation-associated cytochrome domain-containing protein n=1 Tax=Vibrio quintilis TaxID=1117707 RepID=A0A1M7YY34_9VIBR|nr:DUF4405 domain-containing protein [Vibrio quintilis]SHO57463.1 hypothetical protein VQ7734_03233 [Vibrio quintilis]